MAIVEMKRLTLLALRADRDKLLGAMQKMGCVEITEIRDEQFQAYLGRERGAVENAEERLSRIKWAISELSRFEEKKKGLSGLFGGMAEVSGKEAEAVAADTAAVMKAVEVCEACERQEGDLRGREARANAQLKQLRPWLAFDIPVERLAPTRDTVQFAGTVTASRRDALEAALAPLMARMNAVGAEGDEVCIWVVAHKDDARAVQEALAAADYKSAQFAQESGTAAQQREALENELKAIADERKAVEETLRTQAAELPRLRILYELTAQERDRLNAGTRFAQTETAFLMEGWAPALSVEKLEKKLKAISPECEIEFRDAADDEEPPVLLHNGKFASNYEGIVASYSLPSPRGLDPTTIMAPFFACFFGMMVSDAGYGLVLAVFIPLIIRFMNPSKSMRSLMWVLCAGGVFTLIWGAIYDTWFGANLNLAFMKPITINALEDPMKMMYVCIGMGVIHLFTGLGVGAYMNIKRGKPFAALFDQVLWITLIGGLGVMLIVPSLSNVGKIMALVSVVGILLTAGREKPTLIGKLMGGFSSLYGISSWLGDILSYMRLFGMGLATGVIGMVVNMLCGLLFANGVIGYIIGIPIIIFGHCFNAFINVLGAYVHSCRLAYIEFFSKFYEDGGVEFRPLTSNPRYVAIAAEEEAAS